ncbi:hypothetical protein GCM10011583_36020 [Streptomyces camponoticapitis]|uniref:Diacylglycerol O-acyltransferase n=1 Tax=Streptomyces camponoticapitis TaxID=1616125 RepID=A0ABQ2EBI3_9ACTN|nr:hypothetical protein GCM10011583_36020 [Streptomyces camponoticapitis]
MTTELLAPLDLAFWHLESPDHPMHLGALAVFEPVRDHPAAGARTRPGDEALLELLATRAAAVPRLRMRVRDVLLPVGGAAWSVDKEFDVRSHVRHLELPPGDFAEETARLAGELMERPLERGIPPWEMYLLTGGPAPDDTSGGRRPFAVLVKLHHALADGMRAVAIGAGIFDQIADARAAGARRAQPAPPRSWLPGPWQVADMARDRIGELGRALGIGASVVRASRLDLRGTPALTAGSSGTRRLATAVLALEDVRQVRKEHGGTVNDVLLATVAGALRRWMLERGERLPGGESDPRALVPVSGRRPSRARHGSGAGGGSGSGNMLSAYLVGLPVSEPDARARLTAVRRVMDRNKKDGPSRGAGALAVIAGQLHPLAHRLGAPIASNAARILFDVLVTSVPLPRATLSFGGCPLHEIYPMAPLARGQSLAVGLTTYGGQVHVGLVADGKAVPDLDGLAKNMNEELDELLRTTAPGSPAARTEPDLIAEPRSPAPTARVKRPAARRPPAARAAEPDPTTKPARTAGGPAARDEGSAVEPAVGTAPAAPAPAVPAVAAARAARDEGSAEPALAVEPAVEAAPAARDERPSVLESATDVASAEPALAVEPAVEAAPAVPAVVVARAARDEGSAEPASAVEPVVEAAPAASAPTTPAVDVAPAAEGPAQAALAVEPAAPAPATSAVVVAAAARDERVAAPAPSESAAPAPTQLALIAEPTR